MKKTALAICISILSLGCIAANIAVLCSTYSVRMPKILACVAILACLSALYYTLRGFKKYAAKSYIAFMFFCSAFCMFCTIAMAIRFGGVDDSLTAWLVSGNVVLFACFQMLTVTKNLGKRHTFSVCGFIIGIVLIQLVAAIIGTAGTDTLGQAELLAIWVRIITKCVLSATAILMGTAKYIDKAERGSF